MAAFVGRRFELDALEHFGRTAAGGGVTAAIVVGEPGSGKSRLLTEAAGRTGLPRRFAVTGYEPERQVPFAAASDLLRDLAESEAGRGRLGALLFEAPEGESPTMEPVRIFEAAHRALRSKGPALVLVDDVQWVDDLSLALCHYLVRAAEATDEPLALVAAGRPSQAEASLSASLGHVLPPERLIRLELAPLTSAEALELVQELAPELENEKARRFASLARGSPFWLEALVRTEGAEVDAGRLVTARLRGASADAGELLALLVVAGRPLALTDIAQLSGWELPRTEHAVRELVTRGIAVESAAVLQLAHDLIRVAAARELPEEHRLELHRRLADWLADLAGDDIRRLLEALTHRHAAGLSSVDLAGRLARSPQRTLLGEEGLALLTSIADGGDPRDETVGALNDDVAALAAALGRHEVALERRLIAAERRRDPLQRVRARLEAAKSAFALDDRGGARAHLAEARATSTGDDLLDLELDIQQAVLGLWTDGPKEDARALAHDVAGRALRRFEADDRARGPYLEALAVEYEAAYQEDDLEAMVRAAESRAAASRGFDEEIYLTASLAGARALRRIGRLDEARERAGRVWHEAHNRVLPRLALDAGYWLGTFSLQGGRVWEAEEVVESALELASRIGDEARGRHSIERLAAEVAFYSGDWRDGIERLLGYARGASEHAGVELHQLAALWLALAGREDGGDDVLAELGEARACADHAGCPRCTTELRLVGADALVHVGRRTDAAAWLAEWVRMQPHPSPRERFLERRIEALLHDVPPAESLEEVAGQAERLGFVLDALWTNLDLGVVLGDRERAQATDVLAAVAGRARDAGARTVADLAEKRLRGLGVRTWRRGARDGLLTERELTIARLVATGATNPEIAQQLFLSRKTVERHVSNVLRKAGVRNRAELAARAAQLEIEGAHR